MPSIFDLFKRIEKKKPDTAGPPEYLIVGLGNPGSDYVRTRHNAGFCAVDFILKKYDTECRASKFKAYTAKVTIGDTPALIVKPTTFMNNSGQAVRDAASFYKIPPEKIIVFCDDVNFDVGKMRIRESGSDGGHNGLKSIIECLSSDSFPRVRIGVGKKPEEYDLVSWVLGKIPDDDLDEIVKCFEASPDICERIIGGDIQSAMSIYNRR